MIEKGIITSIDRITPTYIYEKPKYIELEGKYISTLLVVDYNNSFEDIIFKNILEEDISIQICIKYEKLNKYDIIKDITYYIGNSGATLKDIGENRQDIDIVSFSYKDAKYIRKELQTNNEEIYNIYTYISVIEDSKEKMQESLEILKGILLSSGLEVREAVFREGEAYKAVMPIAVNNNIVSNVTRRNVLSSGLKITYPFALNTTFDEGGILQGKTISNNSLVVLNRFDREKYKNSNMCIFGSSGSGKSFFTKINILREFLKGTCQYVIDPEGEYLEICEFLSGSIIKIGPNSKHYLNIMDIEVSKEYVNEENEDLEKKGYLETKLNDLKSFFYLMFPNIKDSDYSKIEDHIISAYNKKGIDFDDKSMYKEEKGEIIPKGPLDMPILEDVYDEMKKDDSIREYSNILKTFVHGSLKYFNNHTNVSLDNKFIVTDIKDLGEENYMYGMALCINSFWNNIISSKDEEKIIYIDEIWRIIGVTSNKNTAAFVYKIFKTIRKQNGGAVAITQDVSDLFSLDDGALGRSIISNSSIKAIFSLEEENITILSENINISEKEKISIKGLKKGECMLIAEDNHLLMKVISNDLEKSIIEGDFLGNTNSIYG